MKTKFLTLGLALLLSAAGLNAQEVSTTYRRPSMCSFLVSRQDQQLWDRIQDEYLKVPVSDQYNDHNLSIKVVSVPKKGNHKNEIDAWLANNNVASRVVAKWFDRDIFTGDCSMDLVRQRGLYNATELDKEMASKSVRGMNMLADAGEDLIGNTFVLVHEAHYINNQNIGKGISAGLQIGGLLLSIATGVDVTDLTGNLADMAETFKGFRVKFHTRLYQLQWNDDIQNEFYSTMYRVPGAANAPSKEAFEQNRSKFSLAYIGEVESSGSQNSFLGINEEHPEIMIRKACCRAIDDNIADLQKKYEQFRVKSPISAVNGNEILVAIGMKEGLSATSEYEVLETEEVNGRIRYKRVGTIVPVPGMIWDNRFMALEEGAPGANLKASTFKLKSGKVPYEGLFVRQIK